MARQGAHAHADIGFRRSSGDVPDDAHDTSQDAQASFYDRYSCHLHYRTHPVFRGEASMAVGRFTFIVEAKVDGQNVKTFLRRTCGLTARSMTVLKKSGMGITRGGDLLKAHDVLYAGDRIEIRLPEEQIEIEPVDGMPPILFEDDRLLAVDKPAFMPVHPVKDHQLDTLANRVSAYQLSRGESYVFRALNRLDKDTSGIVLIAKDRISYSLIKPTVEKVYFAVCEGRPECDSGV